MTGGAAAAASARLTSSQERDREPKQRGLGVRSIAFPSSSRGREARRVDFMQRPDRMLIPLGQSAGNVNHEVPNSAIPHHDWDFGFSGGWGYFLSGGADE